MASTYETRKFSVQLRKRNGAFLSCETCKREFYIPPSRIREAEKNGHTTRYCSIKCYRKNGAANPFWGKRHTVESKKKMSSNPNRSKFPKGSENPNFIRYGKEFVPSHVQNIKKYLAHAGISSCQRCGWNKAPILELHHQDRNRKNNSLENIEFLCPNCHTLEHYLAKDGPFHSMK